MSIHPLYVNMIAYSKTTLCFLKSKLLRDRQLKYFIIKLYHSLFDKQA